MKRTGCAVVVAALLPLAGLWTPASAQSVECDGFYTTRKGDSLSKIAKLSSEATGRSITYQKIVDYNTGKLRDPNFIPVGLELFIPCPLDEPPVGDEERIELVKATGDNIKILTGSDYPPYVDDGLLNGGFSYDLVASALQANGGALDYRIDIINDWSSHFVPLMDDLVYDMAFPWFQPDCDRIDELGENGRWRCEKLRFSEPLHQVVVTFYVRKEDAKAITVAEDLEGKQVCRPKGYFTHDLDLLGLNKGRFTHVAAENPTDCFERLVEGEIDVVGLNADTSEVVIRDLGIADQVSEVRRLASIESLHVVVMRKNERAGALLLRFDQGLLALRDSGEARRITTAHTEGR